MLNILWRAKEKKKEERVESYNGLHYIILMMRMNAEASIYKEVMSDK
jgi:hypothetical protein